MVARLTYSGTGIESSDWLWCGVFGLCMRGVAQCAKTTVDEQTA